MKRIFGISRWVLIGAIGLLGCDAVANNEWTGTVDTLPNGALRIENSEVGLWADQETWSIVEELRIGSISGSDAEASDVFGSIDGIVVDELGRIYVLDRQTSVVRVFDRNGDFVRSIGRSGGGPGEFNQAIGLFQGNDGTLWVVDTGNSRYQAFDTAGAYLDFRQRRIGGYSVPWKGGMTPDGDILEVSILSTPEGRHTGLVRFDPSFATVDTVLLPSFETSTIEVNLGQVSMSLDVPFAGREYRWIDVRGGRVWSAITDRYELLEQNLNGDTVRIVGRSFSPPAIPDSARQAAIEQIRQQLGGQGDLDVSDVPTVYPILSRFFPGPDGTLWVRRTRPARQENFEFDIFGADGRFLGVVRTPFSFTPAPVFVGDRMYGQVTDELGVRYVVRARLVR